MHATWDRRVSLSRTADSEEIWTWLWYGGNKFAWKSRRYNTYLSAKPDGSVTLADKPQDWEMWYKFQLNGKDLWKSAHGTWLSGRSDGTVNLQTVSQDWEQWTGIDLDINTKPASPPPTPPTPKPPFICDPKSQIELAIHN